MIIFISIKAHRTSGTVPVEKYCREAQKDAEKPISAYH